MKGKGSSNDSDHDDRDFKGQKGRKMKTEIMYRKMATNEMNLRKIIEKKIMRKKAMKI